MSIFAPNLLEGRAALFPGGATGLDLAIACKFARFGARTVLAKIDKGRRMVANILGEDSLAMAMGGSVEVVFEEIVSAALLQFRRSSKRGSS